MTDTPRPHAPSAARRRRFTGSPGLPALSLFWGAWQAAASRAGMIMGLYAAGALRRAARDQRDFGIFHRSRLQLWKMAACRAVRARYLYELFIMATFDLSTALGLTNIATADAFALALDFAPAALGLGTGWLCDKFAPAAS